MPMDRSYKLAASYTGGTRGSAGGKSAEACGLPLTTIFAEVKNEWRKLLYYIMLCYVMLC